MGMKNDITVDSLFVWKYHLFEYSKILNLKIYKLKLLLTNYIGNNIICTYGSILLDKFNKNDLDCYFIYCSFKSMILLNISSLSYKVIKISKRPHMFKIILYTNSFRYGLKKLIKIDNLNFEINLIESLSPILSYHKIGHFNNDLIRYKYKYLRLCSLKCTHKLHHFNKNTHFHMIHGLYFRYLCKTIGVY